MMEPHPHPTPVWVQMQRRCVFVCKYAGTSKPSKKTLYERQCVCVSGCVSVCLLCCDCCGSSQEDGKGLVKRKGGEDGG